MGTVGCRPLQGKHLKHLLFLPSNQTNKLSNQPENHVTTQETFWGLKMFWGKAGLEKL